MYLILHPPELRKAVPDSMGWWAISEYRQSTHEQKPGSELLHSNLPRPSDLTVGEVSPTVADDIQIKLSYASTNSF